MLFLTLIEQIEETAKRPDFGIIRPVSFFRSIEECYEAFGNNFEKLSKRGYEFICLEEIEPGYMLQVKSRALYKLLDNTGAYVSTADILPSDFCFAFLRRINEQ